MTNFVETTLPPGYCFVSDSWGRNIAYVVKAFHPVEKTLYVTVESEVTGHLCRHAWRHWTASVLQGRKVAWSVRHGVEVADCGSASIHRRTQGWSLFAYGPNRRSHEFIGYVDDLDEAMARFAWLVGATEGIVPR
jgi:hypothetical protein